MGSDKCFGGDYFDWCFKVLCEEEKEGNGNGQVMPCDVGYIYRLEGSDFVDFDQGSAIAFQGAVLRGGIGFQASSPTDITISSPGLYKVTFYLNCQSRSIVGIQLVVNNTPQPVLPQYTYKNNAASQFIYGQGLIEITVPNTVLRILVLKDVTLDKTQQNEPQSVNASVLIKKVCQN
ncbi:hypothetical protein Q3V94_08125 [Caloramator sp. CAR-1]|uniref:hypothetical protein n=1 Tax=Caloramator sp. CAR-1 TaxID=3062777 RepID=UPI0026E260A1|nr:hypothetical protein [Caloramator sp. CAR-1]MDO6355047.1 hypothetical protein [Caloramator sp. CAR-1]